MSMDVFGAAANRQEQKKKEEQDMKLFSMEDNALVRVMEQRKAIKAEEEEERRLRRAQYEHAQAAKQAADIAEMEYFLQAVKGMLILIGRPVESFFINPGGEVITVHRETESIKVQGLNLSSRQMRWISLRKVIEATIG